MTENEVPGFAVDVSISELWVVQLTMEVFYLFCIVPKNFFRNRQCFCQKFELSSFRAGFDTILDGFHSSKIVFKIYERTS